MPEETVSQGWRTVDSVLRWSVGMITVVVIKAHITQLSVVVHACVGALKAGASMPYSRHLCYLTMTRPGLNSSLGWPLGTPRSLYSGSIPWLSCCCDTCDMLTMQYGFVVLLTLGQCCAALDFTTVAVRNDCETPCIMLG